MSWEDNLRKISPYVAGEQPKIKGRIIKLNTNECPYPPSPDVARALKELDPSDLRLYPDPEYTDIRLALSEVYSVPSNRIFVGVGSDDVLATSFMAFFNGQRPVVFPDVTYSFYRVWCGLFRVPYRLIPLDSDLKIDPDDYKGEWGGILFPNPNAPTGVLMGLDRVEELVKSHPECVVICDEAYIDFGGESALSLTDRYENLLVVQTTSKSRSLAGLRVGWAFGSEKLISCLSDVRNSFNSYTMNRPAIACSAAAIRDVESLKRNTGMVIKTRERIASALSEMGFDMPESSANFVFCGRKGTSAQDLFKALRNDGIFVRYFPGDRTGERLRVSIGTDEDMDEFLKFLGNYKGD
ncbi:MAG: aminotransferase class I/II-fold pyridoxal phosphate-dependent enzyme [Lachnospiraceae bacterium]|nr:aminotransferase class I/II-fold pyridoxal phosphate-dependent enzyme [Lachnospiraceae bacterium]